MSLSKPLSKHLTIWTLGWHIAIIIFFSLWLLVELSPNQTSSYHVFTFFIELESFNHHVFLIYYCFFFWLSGVIHLVFFIPQRVRQSLQFLFMVIWFLQIDFIGFVQTFFFKRLTIETTCQILLKVFLSGSVPFVIGYDLWF